MKSTEPAAIIPVLKLKTMKTYFVWVLAIVVLTSGCHRDKKQALKNFDKLEAQFDPPASTLTAFRVAMDVDPDVQALVRSKAAAAIALERLKNTYDSLSDNMVAICAYVIEKRDHREAIPTLEAYLKSNPGERHHVWGPPVSVRALLVLKDIPDGSGGYDDYDGATVVKAVWGP